MSFSFYKVIISNNEIEKNEKENNDYINEKDVDFKRLYDFEMIFLNVYNLFLLLNELRFLKSSISVNDFDF